MALVLPRSNRVRADGAHNAGVAKSRLGRDNRVGDEVVDALRIHRISASFPLSGARPEKVNM